MIEVILNENGVALLKEAGLSEDEASSMRKKIEGKLSWMAETVVVMDSYTTDLPNGKVVQFFKGRDYVAIGIAGVCEKLERDYLK